MQATIAVVGPRRSARRELLPEHEREAEAAASELELAREALKPFDEKAFLEGHLTPVLFGSALKNFGVQRSHRRARRIRAEPARAGSRRRAMSRRTSRR